MTGCSAPLLSAPLQVLEPECFKFVLSKAVGYAIVAGSAGVKLPQLLAIYRARSVGGLAGSSIIIELAATVSSFAYFMALGYPFSTWGENFFLFFGQAVPQDAFSRCTASLRRRWRARRETQQSVTPV